MIVARRLGHVKDGPSLQPLPYYVYRPEFSKPSSTEMRLASIML